MRQLQKGGNEMGHVKCSCLTTVKDIKGIICLLTGVKKAHRIRDKTS